METLAPMPDLVRDDDEPIELLLADDDPVMRSLLASSARAAIDSLAVHEAADGAEAIQIADCSVGRRSRCSTPACRGSVESKSRSSCASWCRGCGSRCIPAIRRRTVTARASSACLCSTSRSSIACFAGSSSKRAGVARLEGSRGGQSWR